MHYFTHVQEVESFAELKERSFHGSRYVALSCMKLGTCIIIGITNLILNFQKANSKGSADISI